MTPIGPRPADWTLSTLGDVGEVKMCKRVMKSQTLNEGEIPFFKIGTFGSEPDAYISKELFDDFKTRFSYPKKGAVLLSAAGTIGRAVEFDGRDAYFQDSNIVWIDNDEEKVLNKFLFYFYKIAKWKTENGGIVVRLYNENLRWTQIAFPSSLSEQRKIADALSSIDSLLLRLDEAIEKKRQIKEGLMQQLLTGKTRLPGFSDEWVNASLGQLFDFHKGNGLSKDDIEATGTNRCVLYGEIFTKYDIDTSDGYSLTDINEGFPSMLGDILMPGSTTTTGIDLVKAIVVLDDGVQLGGDVIVMRKKEDVDPHFMAILISNIARQAVAEKTQGTTIIHLHGKNLTNICYFIPASKKEQETISQLIMQQDAEIKAIAAKRNKYSLIKQGMMQELLTGKTRLI